MKKATLIISMLISIFSYSQVRLGSTASEIRQEFPPSVYPTTSGWDNDGDYYLRISFAKSTTTYYFNEDGRCYLVHLWPNTQTDLNWYVQLYNQEYVIISDTEWKMYGPNGICSVRLIYPPNGGYFFAWRLVQ